MRADAAFLLPLETPPPRYTNPSFGFKCRNIGDQPREISWELSSRTM